MKRFSFWSAFLFVLQVTFFPGLFMVAVAQAAITTSGYVSPDNPGSWDSSTDAVIGDYDWENEIQSGTLTLTDGTSLAVNSGIIGRDFYTDGTVTVQGEGTTWTVNNDLSVGYYGTGTLEITGGGAVTTGSEYWINGFYIGYKADSDWGEYSEGTVSVNGDGSTLTSNDDLYVGYEGSGTLNITEGGSVVAGQDMYIGYIIREAGSFEEEDEWGEPGEDPEGVSTTDSVTVQGADSTLTIDNTLYVGYEGTGELTVIDGGSLTSGNGESEYVNYESYLGYGEGSNGTVTIGTDASWTNQYLSIGLSGQGELNINDGGSVLTGREGYVGADGDGMGSVTVSGTGSSWEVSNALCVGFTSSGELTITDGGTVTVDSGSSMTYSLDDVTGESGPGMYIGYAPGASGMVTVDGSSAELIVDDDLNVGYDGEGILNILNNADVSVGWNTIVGREGTIDFGADGGRLDTQSLFASPSQVAGAGTITTNGIVSDTDLIFDSESGTSYYQTLSFGDVTVRYHQGSWGSLGAGYLGEGSLTIKDGVTVESRDGYLGYGIGSIGTATVDGEGSTWDNSYDLYVGYKGTGSLNILNTASVSARDTFIGKNSHINFGENGGTLTTETLFFGASQLSGTGTIHTSGLVSDLDITIDGASGSAAEQSFTDDNVTINWAQSESGSLGAGYLGDGRLTIKNGAAVESGSGYLGYLSGSNGTIVVDDSSWTASTYRGVYVGYGGKGTLSITNAGTVDAGNFLGLGYGEDSSGTVNINGIDSIVYSASTKVGYSGNGNLNITNGGTLQDDGYSASLGSQSGSSGIVTIDGEGSSWSLNSGDLYLGRNGTGTLAVTNGGILSVGKTSYAGYGSGSSGTAMIDGDGSAWETTGSLVLGNNGALTVTNGGLATANYVSIGSGSTATVDVNSSLKAGTGDNTWSGTIYNRGTLRLVAGTEVDSGTYAPLSYGTLNNYGRFQVFGGTWDADNHFVTVADAVSAQGAGGGTADLDLSENQRVMITDNTTGMSVGAAFFGTDTSTIISLTATAVSSDEFASLESLLAGTEDEIFSAWNFSIDGYTVSEENPVSLSLFADSADDLLSLTIWHLMGGEWTEYDGSDLAFDGKYASFVAKSFSGYAVTGTSSVPLPGALVLLASGLLGMVSLNRRNFNNNA